MALRASYDNRVIIITHCVDCIVWFADKPSKKMTLASGPRRRTMPIWGPHRFDHWRIRM